MLVVRQGEVAVMKSFVGLPTLDTSGVEFKFGSIVHPGRRGIWQEPLRTGKYPINPRIYAAEIVPTSILTLNWASVVSQAHNLDASLSPIEGKSREGFVFRIDLQVQIHVSDTKAPKVISMVGTMQNLVNEVLQSAVGNHFRNTLQRLEAVRFIETRDEVQASAMEAVTRYLTSYEVETRGVYIQDVVFPERARGGADRARDRQAGEGDVPRAARGAERPHRGGEGPRHRRHAGPAGDVAGVDRDQLERGRGACRPGARRGGLHRDHGSRRGDAHRGDRTRRGHQGRSRSAWREATATEAVGLAEARALPRLRPRPSARRPRRWWRR